MMFKIPMTFLAAMAWLAVLWPCSIAKAEFAVHRSDTFGLTSDYPQLYDANREPDRVALLFSNGRSPSRLLSPEPRLRRDDRKPCRARCVTGSLGYTARVLSWSPSGALLSEIHSTDIRPTVLAMAWICRSMAASWPCTHAIRSASPATMLGFTMRQLGIRLPRSPISGTAGNAGKLLSPEPRLRRDHRQSLRVGARHDSAARHEF